MEILAQNRLDGRMCSVLESSLAALRKFLCGMPSNPTLAAALRIFALVRKRTSLSTGMLTLAICGRGLSESTW